MVTLFNNVDNLEDLELNAYRQVKLCQELEYLGKQFILRFLKSEQGKELNGQHCTVIGADSDVFEGRFHAKLNSGRIIKVKLRNLGVLESAVINEMREVPEFYSGARSHVLSRHGRRGGCDE